MGSPGWPSGPLGLGLTFHARETKAFHKVDLVKVAQSCPTLCSSMDCSPPGSSVPGILQARTLWWGGVPSPPPGDLPNPGVKPGSPALQEVSLPREPPGKPSARWAVLKFQCHL